MANESPLNLRSADTSSLVVEIGREFRDPSLNMDSPSKETLGQILICVT